MIKGKVISSLELLKVSKPRVKLMIKNLIDDLIRLCNENYSQNLSDFRNLCLKLKSNGVNDISDFISKNVVDYDVKINDLSKTSSIEFIFGRNFPISKLQINDLSF